MKKYLKLTLIFFSFFVFGCFNEKITPNIEEFNTQSLKEIETPKSSDPSINLEKLSLEMKSRSPSWSEILLTIN